MKRGSQGHNLGVDPLFGANNSLKYEVWSLREKRNVSRWLQLMCRRCKAHPQVLSNKGSWLCRESIKGDNTQLYDMLANRGNAKFVLSDSIALVLKSVSPSSVSVAIAGDELTCEFSRYESDVAL